MRKFAVIGATLALLAGSTAALTALGWAVDVPLVTLRTVAPSQV